MLSWFLKESFVCFNPLLTKQEHIFSWVKTINSLISQIIYILNLHSGLNVTVSNHPANICFSVFLE